MKESEIHPRHRMLQVVLGIVLLLNVTAVAHMTDELKVWHKPKEPEVAIQYPRVLPPNMRIAMNSDDYNFLIAGACETLRMKGLLGKLSITDPKECPEIMALLVPFNPLEVL